MRPCAWGLPVTLVKSVNFDNKSLSSALDLSAHAHLKLFSTRPTSQLNLRELQLAE